MLFALFISYCAKTWLAERAIILPTIGNVFKCLHGQQVCMSGLQYKNICLHLQILSTTFARIATILIYVGS